MTLLRLDITNFRNLQTVRFEPIPQGFNLIFGDNGSGKTSILEAIYYLSLGRSFRTSVIKRVIRDSTDNFSLFAQILGSTHQNIPVGLERFQNGDSNMRIAGKDVRSIAELASMIPVQLIHSNCYSLLEAPAFRRKYLDWGVFYSSKEFYRIWKQYENALKQRNAALRGQLSKQELKPWTLELINQAEQLDIVRNQYTKSLIPQIRNSLNKLLILDDLELSYQPGWSRGKTYQEALEESFEKDMAFGFTQYGPHRADLKIAINHTPAKDILSRGQQKLFVCAMILAQGILLQNEGKKPIYLVDDLPSELDSTSRSNLMSLLSSQNAQVFLTAVDRSVLDGEITNNPIKMFHVEHGKVVDIAELVS